MRRDTLISRCVLACGLAWACAGTLSIPAHSQIATIVDEHGHTIFVNASDLPSPAAKMARASRFRSLTTPPAEISGLVEKTADRHQVDPKLVRAIIQVESAYNARAVSRKGAKGLMQLIPSTAERFGVQNSFNPKQNIEGGVTYLRYLLDLFDGSVPLSVAAYNAGEHAVLRQGGIPKYRETVDYVEHVTSLYGSTDAFFLKKPAAPESPPIYRLVDAQGVVHYTNGL